MKQARARGRSHKYKYPQDGKNHRVIFSGDIGEPERPIIKDPAVFDEAEYIVIESTYGTVLTKNTRTSIFKNNYAIVSTGR